MDIVVVPQGKHQDHATVKGVAHGLHAAPLGKRVRVVKRSLLRSVEAIADGIKRLAAEDCWCGGDHLAILHKEAADLLEFAGVGVVTGDKLGHDCHDLGGVDGKAGAGSKKRLIAEAKPGGRGNEVFIEGQSVGPTG